MPLLSIDEHDFEKDDRLLRIILIGDIVGKPGMKITCAAVPWLRSVARCDVIVANAENAADGAGLTIKQFETLIAAGIDGVTLGDHIYRKKEINAVLSRGERVVKPANYPSTAPGHDHCILRTQSGHAIALVSLMGRVFMRPVDCPFEAIDRVLKHLDPEIKIIVCDVHAEATSDKQSLGYYLDGRVSAVLGTHTHVATADQQILPKGTAFQCDVGMTGPYLSILGRAIEPVIKTATTFDPNSFHVATEDVRLSGTWFDVDPQTGLCHRIQRLQWTSADLTELSRRTGPLTD